MKHVSKLNVLLFLIIGVLVFFLTKQYQLSLSQPTNNEISELTSDLVNFRVHNIGYHLDALETLRTTENISNAKKQIETTMLSLFSQHYLSGDIDNARLKKSSLITLCQLNLYNRSANFEKDISDKVSVFVQTYFDENSDSLEELYSSNQINSDTCASNATIIMPNFRKFDAELEKLQQ